MHVSLTLSPSRLALPRILAVIQGKGWRIGHMCAEGTSVCLLLDGADRRVVTVLSRIVDVVVVRTGNDAEPCCHRRALPVIPVHRALAGPCSDAQLAG